MSTKDLQAEISKLRLALAEAQHKIEMQQDLIAAIHKLSKPSVDA